MATEYISDSIDFKEDFPNKIQCIPFAKYSDNLLRSPKGDTIKKTRAIVAGGIQPGQLSIHEIVWIKPKKKQKDKQKESDGNNNNNNNNNDTLAKKKKIMKTKSFEKNYNKKHGNLYDGGYSRFEGCSAQFSHSFITRDNGFIINYHPFNGFYNAYNIKENKWLLGKNHVLNKVGNFGRNGIRCLFISDEVLVVSSYERILFYLLSNGSNTNDDDDDESNYKLRKTPYFIGKYMIETDLSDLGYHWGFNDHGMSLIEYNGRKKILSNDDDNGEEEVENINIQHKFSLMLFGGESPFLQSFLRLDVLLTIPIQNVKQYDKDQKNQENKPAIRFKPKPKLKGNGKNKNMMAKENNESVINVLKIKETYIDYRKIKLINFEEKVNRTPCMGNYDDAKRKDLELNGNSNNELALTEKTYLKSFGTQTVLNRNGERIIMIIGGKSSLGWLKPSPFSNDLSIILYNVDKNEMTKIEGILPFTCRMTPATMLIGDSCLVLQDCRYCMLDLKKLFGKVGCVYGGYGFNVKLKWKYERIMWIGFHKNKENDECLIHQLPKDIVKKIIKMFEYCREIS